MTVEGRNPAEPAGDRGDARPPCFRCRWQAEGSCEIGGNISTNAGGVQVLRTATRELVLGLEVVLPSGELWVACAACARTTQATTSSTLFIGRRGRSASSPRRC